MRQGERHGVHRRNRTKAAMGTGSLAKAGLVIGSGSGGCPQEKWYWMP